MDFTEECKGDTCARERYWSELSIEEKIERMRGEVQRHGRQLEELMSENYRLRRTNPDEVYF